MYYVKLLNDKFQAVKVHDCVGCHNKGNPRLMTEYELENLTEDKPITFTVNVLLDDKDKVFTDDLTEQTTEFVIENPVVS